MGDAYAPAAGSGYHPISDHKLNEKRQGFLPGKRKKAEMDHIGKNCGEK